MPINYRQTPEPLTFASERNKPILAECEAYRRLLHEIVRYGKRETMGRSVLISGHRGSGKTTLVRLAIQKAQEELEHVPGAARPLLVPLHGPDLLAGESVLEQATAPASEKTPDQNAKDDGKEPAKDGKTKANPASAPSPDKNAKNSKDGAKAMETAQDFSDMRAALRMLTEGLHRAYIGELARCYAARLEGQLEMRELVAQLQVELDHAPELDALRFFWERSGSLASGVLFPASQPRGTNQGYRELVAASTVIEAFMRVAGKLEDTSASTRQSEFSEKTETKANWSGKDLLNPLTGLLAGGVAGAGILQSGAAGPANPVVAAIAAAATAVGSTFVLNRSATRSRQIQREKKLNFIWDTSIASLDRMLPVMVERIVESGLAPIFVVDELDKINGIEEKMEKLLHHLKHLITEKTFFCLLGDRSYFEHIVQTSRSKAYAREHTFFSERFFVHYRPEDLHKYLSDIQAPTASENEKLDAQVLPYLLLERAKMHPIDLRRAMTELVDLPEGDVRSLDGYKMAIFMQAAVECVLDDEMIRTRLRQDPAFARLAYDALYSPARSWEKGQKELDLSRDNLRAKIQERMAADANGSPAPAADLRLSNLTDLDLDRLYDAVQRIAQFLRDPSLLVNELSSRQGSPELHFGKYKQPGWNAVREIASGLVKTPLLGPQPGPPGTAQISRWLRDPFGRALDPTPVGGGSPVGSPLPPPPGGAPGPSLPPPPGGGSGGQIHLKQRAKNGETGTTNVIFGEGKLANGESIAELTRKRIESIRASNKLVNELTDSRLNLDKLASQIRILSISPAWPTVESAIRAFETWASAPDTSMNAQVASSMDLIEAYSWMLDQSKEAVEKALRLAMSLCTAMPGSFARRIDRALRILSADLRFGYSSPQQILEVLNTFDDPLQLLLAQVPDDIRPLFSLSTKTLALTREFEAWSTPSEPGSGPIPLPPEMFSMHQFRWRKFLVRRFRTGESVFMPTLGDLLLRAKGEALPFKTELNEMTYGDYGKLLQNSHLPTIDSWLKACIYIELGFGREMAEFIGSGDTIEDEALDLIEIGKSEPRVQRTGDRAALILGGAQERVSRTMKGEVVVHSTKGAGSMAAEWLVTTQHSILPLFESDVAVLLQFIPAPIRAGLEYVLYDAPLPSVPPLIQQSFHLVPPGAPLMSPSDIYAQTGIDATINEVRKRTRGEEPPGPQSVKGG